MPATVAKIISRAQLDFSTDASLDIDIVNEYVRKVAQRLRIMTSLATTPSVSGQQAYYVSSGAPVRTVLWSSGDVTVSPLIRISEDEAISRGMDVWDTVDTANVGTPQYWWGVYGKIVTNPQTIHGLYGFALFPIPDSVVTMRYMVNFADTAYTVTTETCELPDRAIDVVVKGCQYERAIRVQPEKAKLYWENYLMDLQDCEKLMLEQKGQTMIVGETAYDYGL